MPATIPQIANEGAWQTYKLCLPPTISHETYTSIITGLLVQLSYGYFWDGTEEEIENAKKVGQEILSYWIDQGCGMTGCEDLANCIETDEGVQTALNDWFGASAYNQILEQLNENFSNPTTITAGQGYVCKDYFFNILKNVILELHDQSTTFFESIETALNPSELINQIGDEISTNLQNSRFSSATMFLDAINIATQLVDSVSGGMYEEYEQSANNAIFDIIACEYMCDELNLCEFSLDKFSDWLKSEVSISIDTSNIINVLDALISGQYLDLLLVKATFWAQLEFARMANFFMGFMNELAVYPAITRLIRIVEAQKDTPDTNHNQLCDPCASQTFKLQQVVRSNNQFGYTPSNTYAGDSRLYSTRYSNNNRWWIRKYITKPHDLRITKVTVRTRIDEIIRSTSQIAVQLFPNNNYTPPEIGVVVIAPLLPDNLPDGGNPLGMRDYEFNFTTDNTNFGSIMITMYHSIGGNQTGACGLEHVIIEGIGDPIIAQAKLGGVIIP